MLIAEESIARSNPGRRHRGRHHAGRHQIFHPALTDRFVGVLQPAGWSCPDSLRSYRRSHRKCAGIRRGEVFRIDRRDPGNPLGTSHSVLDRTSREIGCAGRSMPPMGGNAHGEQSASRIDILHDLIVGKSRRSCMVVMETDHRLIGG